MESEVKVLKTGRDYNWFIKHFPEEDIKKFAGEWIAIKNEQIISHGKDFKEVLREAEEESDKPLLIKIPKDREILIL